MSPVAESLVRRFDAVRPHLTERQRRVWLGAEARELGSGGVRIVAEAVRVSPDTVRRGRDELDDPQPLEVARSRGPGGGRKRAEELDPGLADALDRLVEPESRGDPMTPLRWTCKSLRTLAEQLRSQGHQASPTLVARLLHESGYSLQANAKTLEGAQHPDRDAQFRHIHDTTAEFLSAGDPVISTGHQQVGQDRAPSVLPGHPELAGRAPGQPRDGDQHNKFYLVRGLSEGQASLGMLYEGRHRGFRGNHDIGAALDEVFGVLPGNRGQHASSNAGTPPINAEGNAFHDMPPAWAPSPVARFSGRMASKPARGCHEGRVPLFLVVARQEPFREKHWMADTRGLERQRRHTTVAGGELCAGRPLPSVTRGLEPPKAVAGAR